MVSGLIVGEGRRRKSRRKCLTLAFDLNRFARGEKGRTFTLLVYSCVCVDWFGGG